MHLDPLLDHLGGIDLVVARRIGEVDDYSRPNEKAVEFQLGNVLASGEEVDLTI
jgi:hypothetical protein